MSKKAAGTTTNAPNGNALGVASVGLLFLDTTARLFVPSVGGTALGLWADNAWGTKPWGTIIGVTLGALLAFALVYAQVRSVNKSKGRAS